MEITNRKTFLIVSFASLAACFGSAACEQPKTSGNSIATNSAATTVNSNNTSSANVNSSGANDSRSDASSSIDTKEPEKYQASVLLKLETSGAQQMPIPPIKADVARSGADRRMEFKLPTGETIIYLDKGGRQLLISPQKKQYAELNKESVGVDVRSLLMPEQIVNQVKRMKGVERVGEDTVDGRAAVKYRFTSSANTQSQAGRAETESYILVDKETGLPLRSYTNGSAQGNVQGVNSLNVVTEMNNIKTDVDPKLFDEPTDFQKVAPEQIRAQLDAIFKLAGALMGQMMSKPAASPSAATTPQ